MREGVIMISKIKTLLDAKGKNPHWLSQQANITYRIVLRLCSSETIPPTTPIGTLWSIAEVLGTSVDDLYIIEKRP